MSFAPLPYGKLHCNLPYDFLERAMSCERCRMLMPHLPEAGVWGPPLWTLLHGLAERCDQIVRPHTTDYAVRQWIRLLEAIPMSLPCPICQVHATEWLAAHPVKPLLKTPVLKTWIVDWLYEFHEQVNLNRGVPSFDKALLHATYGAIPLRDLFESTKEIITKAKEINGSGFLQWKQWVGMMHMLLCIHGV
jgi:hypothetical protein